MSDTTQTTAGQAPAPTVQTVRGTVIYTLSTTGQRAALLAGLDARAEQRISDVAIPADMLSHCDIAPDGAVALNLTGRWPQVVGSENADFRPAVRISSRSTAHDAPISDPVAAFLEALEAARAALTRITPVWEATQADRAREREERDARAKASYEAHQAAADAVAAQETARAKSRADYFSAWVAEHGTENQRARHEACVLPEQEVIDAMADQAFAVVTVARYRPITRAECLDALADPDDAPTSEPTCQGSDPDALTAAQWDALTAVSNALPDGSVVKVRRIQCGLYDSLRDDDVARYQVHAKVHIGPITVVRAFACPGV